MRTEKYKNYAIGLAINLSMLLIFWGGMLRKSFNADTVSHMTSQDADIFWNLADGRFIIALGDAILMKLGLRVTNNLSITMFFAFLFFAMAMLVVQKIFKDWQPEERWERIGWFFGVNLVFLNVLFAELLMFGECSAYFGFGYFMASLGVLQFTRKRYISMFLLFLAGVCSYQYTMIFAAILIAFYICLKHREELTLKAVKEELFGIIACMSAGVLNLLSVKLLVKIGVIEKFGKYAGWGDGHQKLTDFKASLISLYRSSMEIFPDLWLPLLFTLGVFALMIYSCIKSKTLKKFPFILIVFLGSMVMLYAIPFMQESFSFPPRMAFCFYLLQGMLAVTAYAVCTTGMRKLLTTACMGYILIQLLFSDFVVTNHFVSNTLDEVYVSMMYQEVLKYEEETGTRVTRIAIYKDIDAPDNYEEVNYHVHQINERTLGTATNSLIWKVTGRHFEDIGNQQEIYDQYFKDRNWDYLDLSQQLVIIGDTAYWCIF